MKTMRILACISLLSPALCLPAFAQGTAFTYEGRLNQGGSPANGSYDFRFSLFPTNTGGTLAYGFLTNSATAVSNGLFTVTLDFGAGAFNGTSYWLQIGVRTNGGGAFSPLSPRQEIMPVPYAIYSENSGVAVQASGVAAGTVAAPQLNTSGAPGAGQILAYDGANLVWTNPTAAPLAWTLTGNAGTVPGTNFLGTSDNRPLYLEAFGQRGLELQYGARNSGFPNFFLQSAMNVIGGYWGNTVSNSVIGATIAGGGEYAGSALLGFNPIPNVVSGDFGTVGGGYANLAGPGSTVPGGDNNSATGTGSTVGGGNQNNAGPDYSTVAGGTGNNANGGGTVGGGQNNTASADATVGGGLNNTASLNGAAVGGGQGNTASGEYSMIPGGIGNSAAGYGSFAAGQHAHANHDWSFVWSDGSQNPFLGAPANSAFSALAAGGVFFYNGTNGVHIDGLGNNDGALDFGIKFGGALDSGEGIASKRTSGGNQYGLDFYTTSNNRMSIAANGFVGINTTTPTERLDVNGKFLVVEGSGGVRCYLGDDGFGNDVQLGSLASGVTAVSFYNATDGAYMHIGCSSITIHGGADLAEPFQITSPAGDIPQGAVVVIDDQNPGHLKLSDQPYDTRVAGVVSGANGVNPGIQMQQQGLLEGGKNVALTGRVYVLADSANGAIKPGDLLTTSRIPGHAMKATDHAKAPGAILGKAMTGLGEGQGTVLVLVTLQ